MRVYSVTVDIRRSDRACQRDLRGIRLAGAQIAGIADHQRLRLAGTAFVAQGEGDVAAGISAVALEHDAGSAAAADQAGVLQGLADADQGFFRFALPAAVPVDERYPAGAPVESGIADSAVNPGAERGAYPVDAGLGGGFHQIGQQGGFGFAGIGGIHGRQHGRHGDAHQRAADRQDDDQFNQGKSRNSAFHIGSPSV